jgi:DNA-binding MarR family transcriptional regulator
MSALCSLRPHDQVDFSFLKDKLNLTDGNLGAHLRALEDAAYIVVEKTFVERRPKTFVAASANGRKAFAAHVAALQAILRSS